jgi:hypothetical protein
MSLDSQGCNGLDFERVALQQPHVGDGGWRCCQELRSIDQSQEKSSSHFFPYRPATLLMGPQEDAEIILFVASWPTPVFPAVSNRAITRGRRAGSQGRQN